MMIGANAHSSEPHEHRARSATGRRRPSGWLLAALATAILLASPLRVAAQSTDASSALSSDDAAAALPTDPIYIPDLSQWVPKAVSRESLSSTLQILVLMTLLTVAPSIILMMTCFARILVVLVLLRQALGTQQVPPSQVLVGLAVFMTLLVMAPTWDRVRSSAIAPYLDGKLAQLDAIERAGSELKGFMFDQIEAAGNEQDVYMLYEYAAQRAVPEDESLTRDAVPFTALVPAFLLSELKVAFVLGFRIYLPFLVIDMVISTVLVAMGMMMLPPVLISLPFKLLLFVLADGWHLIAGALMASVQN